jgi:hypothetical protein
MKLDVVNTPTHPFVTMSSMANNGHILQQFLGSVRELMRENAHKGGEGCCPLINVRDICCGLSGLLNFNNRVFDC